MGIDDWEFWQAFRVSIEAQLWPKAARHELGAGLEGGTDFTTLSSCWTQERRFRVGLVETPRCPRCEEEDEDMHHRVWRCKANTGEIFDKTQHLVHKGTQPKDTLDHF